MAKTKRRRVVSMHPTYESALEALYDLTDNEERSDEIISSFGGPVVAAHGAANEAQVKRYANGYAVVVRS